MDYKKIKKSSITLTEVVFGIILFIGFFTGMFIYLNKNVEEAGITIDEKYTDAYSKLNETRNDLDSNIQSIKDSFENIGEADSSWQVAWNGFKALGETMKLPINFVATTLQAMSVSFITLDAIPEWVKTLIGITITALIVFLILALLKGEQRM